MLLCETTIMNNKIRRYAIFALIAVFVICLIPNTTHYEQTSPELVLSEKTPVSQPVKAQITLNPALKRVCACESTGNPNNEPRQFNADGSVLRGVENPLDIGMCQINLHYHQSDAEKMGVDLFTEQGNIEFANALYARQGLTPWNWSKKCWQ